MFSNRTVTGRPGRKKRFRGKLKEILEGNVGNIIIAHLLYVCDCHDIKLKKTVPATEATFKYPATPCGSCIQRSNTDFPTAQ